MRLNEKVFKKINEIGKDNYLSVIQIAKKMGISRAKYYRLMHDQDSLTLSMVEEFCKNMNLDIDQLINF